MALIRLRGDELCQDGETCAALYRRTARRTALGRRTALVRGYRVTDPETLAELAKLNIPAHEGVVEVPLDMLYDLRPDDTAEVIP